MESGQAPRDRQWRGQVDRTMTVTVATIFSFLRRSFPQETRRPSDRPETSCISCSRSRTIGVGARRPSLIPQAIEEALRLETPLLTITRLATRDTEIGGVAVPQGSTIMLMLAAANREETRYELPDHFDVTRDSPTPHMSSGTVRTSASEYTWPAWRCESPSICSWIACRICASTRARTIRTSRARSSALRLPFPCCSVRDSPQGVGHGHRAAPHLNSVGSPVARSDLVGRPVADP